MLYANNDRMIVRVVISNTRGPSIMTFAIMITMLFIVACLARQKPLKQLS